jgi:hypothetical protein
MSTYVAPRALRAIEQPPEIDRLLAIWGQAFDDKAIPVRARPRVFNHTPLYAQQLYNTSGYLETGQRLGRDIRSAIAPDKRPQR